MGKRGNKICCLCSQDVSRRYRLKDAAGRYYCDKCFAELGTRAAASHPYTSPKAPAKVALAKPPVAQPAVVKAAVAKTAVATPRSKSRARKIKPVMREILPDAKVQYLRACKSINEIAAAADGLLTLWSDFLSAEDETLLDQHPEAVEGRNELFAATRKWLEQERQRLGIDEATADILENGENPFDTTSASCFLR